MIWEAFAYPVESDNFVKNVLISFTSILFFPLIPLALGYFTKLIKNKAAGKECPEYGDWKNLYFTGSKYLFVGVLWFFLDLPVIYVASIIDMQIVYLFSELFSLALIYALPAIYSQFAENESIIEAFNPLNMDYVLSLRYFKTFLYIIASLIIITLAQIVLAITIVGALVVPFTFAYEMMVYNSLIGEARPEQASFKP